MLRLISSWVVAGVWLWGSLAPAATDDRKWHRNMQELAKTISDLLPDVVSQKPLTGARAKQMEKSTKKLADLAHTIKFPPGGKGSALPPDADPSLVFLSSLFEREVAHAYRALRAGNSEYARNVLRVATTYCIACHTRHDQGTDFPVLRLSAKTEKLDPMEKAELYAATRQFDKAFDGFQAIVSDPEIARKRPLEWGRAVRGALTIAVRVKKDPELALGIVNRIQAFPATPEFFKEYVGGWKESVVAWKDEEKKKAGSEEDLYEEAVRLSDAARAKQKYPFDRSGDILYLRASSAVHDLLSAHPRGKHASDALLLGGIAYEVLQDRLMSALPEMYYEACIRGAPHTAVSRRCFHRYEELVHFGYTGSGGTSIPPTVEKVVEELRGISAVKVN